MKILGSRQLPCGHGSVRVTERDRRIISVYGRSVRVCLTCRSTRYFHLVPAEEAQRITGDVVVRIEWVGEVPR